MTALELIQIQLSDAEYQLTKCFDGLSDEVAAKSLLADGMTVAQIFEHLCEAYEAEIAHLQGKEHEWGSYSIADMSISNVKSVWTETRAKAVAAVVASESDDALKSAHSYIVAHDYYHVGQICAVRVTHDSSFDAMSIYNF